MTRRWVRRDHEIERAAIEEAAMRLLADLTPESEPPTVTDLATTANLRRDYLYDHKDLVAKFKANVAKGTGTSKRFVNLQQNLREQNEKVQTLRSEIVKKDEEIRLLRLLLVETTLELDDVKTLMKASPLLRSAPDPSPRRSTSP